MKKIYLLGIIVLTLGTVFFLIPPRPCPLSTQKHIAIIYANGSAPVELCHQAILQTAHRSAHASDLVFSDYPYNPQSKIELSTICETALNTEPDLVIAIGTMATQALIAAKNKRDPENNSSTQILTVGSFCEASECPPEAAGVMMSGYDDIIPARLLCAAKPTTRRVAIPYNSALDVANIAIMHATGTKESLEKLGVHADLIPLDGFANAVPKLKTLLASYDTLFLLELSGLIQITQNLVRLCNELGITCYCCTIAGITTGAAITYATSTEYMGIVTFTIAMHLLYTAKKGDPLPIVSLANGRKLFINRTAANLQNVTINRRALKKNILNDPHLAWLAESKEHIHIFSVLS